MTTSTTIADMNLGGKSDDGAARRTSRYTIADVNLGGKSDDGAARRTSRYSAMRPCKDQGDKVTR